MAHEPLGMRKPALTMIEGKGEARLFNALARWTPVNVQIHRMSKVRLPAWLASQARPDLRLGEAADEGLWHFDSKAFRPSQPLWQQFKAEG